MSEQLLLINPRRKKRHKARRKAKAKHRARRRRTTRADLARVHFDPRGGPPRRLKINPRHRRYKVRGRYRKRRTYRVAPMLVNPRRRRRLRNPRFGISSFGGLPVKQLAVPFLSGIAGAAAANIAWGYASPYLPAQLQTGYVGTAVKLGAAVGLALIAKPVIGRQKAMAGLLGALTVIGYGAFRDALRSAFPMVKGLEGYADYVDYNAPRDWNGMGAYMTPQLGYISPAPVLPSSSAMGAYMSPDLAPAMNGYDWRSDGM